MLSIRTKLTLLYSIAILTLLVIYSFGLYWASTNLIMKSNYQFVANEMDLVTTILKSKQPNFADVSSIIKRAPQSKYAIYHYYIRILNKENRLVMETPGMSKVFPIKNTIVNKFKEKNKHYFFFNKSKYLVAQSSLTEHGLQIGSVQILLDISYHRVLLGNWKILIIFSLLSLLGASVGGWLITSRGMKSLTALTETVENISAHSLHARINVNDWPLELNTLGENFNHMLERIDHSFTRVKQFSADLSHELRTPIMNLMCENETALCETTKPEQFKQLLESNLEELGKLQSLIENILFLAKNDEVQTKLIKKSLPVCETIQTICQFFQSLYEEKNLSVQLQGDSVVLANPDMFQRLIINLISNAIKFTEPGGRINIAITENTQSLQIKISDTGIGIEEGFLQNIYHRFHRANNSKHIDGSGLGLAIVKSIMDIHAGIIQIQSTLHIGTTVSLQFPK